MILLTKGLEDFMIPCLNKKLFGFECMGCGLQRSLVFVFKGQFTEAFLMYPAIYTLMALMVFILIHSFKNFKNGFKIITILAVTNVMIIVASYLIKLYLK